MASVFRIFKTDFEPHATFENVGAPSVDSPKIDDPEQFDRDVEAAFQKARKGLDGRPDGAAEDAPRP